MDLDKDLKLNKLFENKNTNIFYNSFRYLPAVYFAGFKSTLIILMNYLKKNQINKIYFYGEIGNEFYNNEMLYDDLSLKNSNIKILRYSNSKLLKKNLINIKKIL